MWALVRFAVAYALCVLLAGVSPVGTGDSVHRDQLVHPAFPHLHILDGQVVVHVPGPSAASEVRTDTHPSGPALGAGADATAAFAADAQLPPPPTPQPVILPTVSSPAWRLTDERAPRGRTEPPPDPPPPFNA
jgi:hypothetical protein